MALFGNTIWDDSVWAGSVWASGVWDDDTGPAVDPIAEMFARLGGTGTWVDPLDGQTVFSDTAGTTQAVQDGLVARIDAAGGVPASFTNGVVAEQPILRANGMEFDWIDDRLFAPDDPALRFGTGDVTFAMAALSTGASEYGTIFNKRSSIGGPGWNFLIDRPDGRFRTLLQDASTTRLGYAGANGSWPINTWLTVIVEVDRAAGVARHFINGVYQSGFDLTLGTLGDISNTEAVSLGADSTGGTRFSGTIGRLLAIDKLLSPEDKTLVEQWLQGSFA